MKVLQLNGDRGSVLFVCGDEGAYTHVVGHMMVQTVVYSTCCRANVAVQNVAWC